MSGLTFRRATPDDLPALRRLEQGSFEEAWSEDAIRSELERMAGWTALASRGAQPAGYACFLRAADEVELLRIAVDPELRRHGVGRGLLEWCLADLSRQGAVRCFLEVRADNRGAISFYRRQGFEPAGRRPGYYRDGCDALLFQRSLDASQLRESTSSS